MKKIQAFLLSAILLLSFSACKSQTANTKSVESKPASTTASSEVSSVGDSNSSSIESINKKFDLTRSEMLNNINTQLAKENYSAISDENSKVEKEDDKDTGKIITYTYPIDTGAELIIRTDEDDCITMIMYYADKNKITVDSVKKFGYCVGMTESGMAGDEVAEVDKKLNLDNFNNNATTVAFTDKCSFTYSVDEKSLYFIISPL